MVNVGHRVEGLVGKFDQLGRPHRQRAEAPLLDLESFRKRVGEFPVPVQSTELMENGERTEQRVEHFIRAAAADVR
jgi:hypothetical protein